MKKIIIIAAIALTVAVAVANACTVEDSVPKITDPDNITVDGQPMTAEAFYNAYCKLKTTNETCIAVQRTVEVKSVLKSLKDRTVPRF